MKIEIGASVVVSRAPPAEMVPFSRLPDLVLPDMALARDTAAKLKQILAMA